MELIDLIVVSLVLAVVAGTLLAWVFGLGGFE